jgi:hypothetical protein
MGEFFALDCTKPTYTISIILATSARSHGSLKQHRDAIFVTGTCALLVDLKHQFKSRRAVREDTMLRGRFAKAPVGYVTTVFRKSQTVKVLSCAIRAIGWSAIMGFAPSEATFLVWPVLWGIWRHWLVYQEISLSIAMCVSKTLSVDLRHLSAKRVQANGVPVFITM